MSSILCNTHLLAQIKCSAETRLQVERSFHFLLISIVTMWEGEFEPWTSVGNTHLLATRLLAERSFHLINIKKQSILQLQPSSSQSRPWGSKITKNIALHVQSTKGYSKSKTATYHNSIDPWLERTPHHD